MRNENLNQFVVVLLVVFISALFLSMIRSFLLAIFLAGLFSALAEPIYRRFNKAFQYRRSLASMVTLLLITIVGLLPLAVLTGVVVGEAIEVSKKALPWIQTQIQQPGAFTDFLQSIPYYEMIAPYSESILQQLGEMVGLISQFLIDNLSSVTMGAVNFLFMLFVWFYAMYFFLIDGDKLLEKILYYLPLKDHDEQLMLDKFNSVTRATLKGMAVIGILQGGLAGLAFWVVGIPSATFWGVIMALLSIIPSVGSAIIWGPAAILLAIGGSYGKAAGLALFCAVVVGSVDNILRPALVGKDTRMHELMIFFGTLGGIFMFGIAGIIIGPIVAALFLTIWDIYGQTFQPILPETGIALHQEQEPQAEMVSGGQAKS